MVIKTRVDNPAPQQTFFTERVAIAIRLLTTLEKHVTIYENTSWTRTQIAVGLQVFLEPLGFYFFTIDTDPPAIQYPDYAVLHFIFRDEGVSDSMIIPYSFKIK